MSTPDPDRRVRARGDADGQDGGAGQTLSSRLNERLPGDSARRLWGRARSTLWAVPALCVATSIGLAVGLIVLDHESVVCTTRSCTRGRPAVRGHSSPPA